MCWVSVLIYYRVTSILCSVCICTSSAILGYDVDTHIKIYIIASMFLNSQYVHGTEIIAMHAQLHTGLLLIYTNLIDQLIKVMYHCYFSKKNKKNSTTVYMKLKPYHHSIVDCVYNKTKNLKVIDNVPYNRQ